MPQQGAGWRLAVGLVAAVLGFLVLAALGLAVVYVVAILLGYEFSLDDDFNAGLLLATNLGLASLIPFAGALTWTIYQVKPRWVSSLFPRIRWRWLLICLAVAAVVWLPLGALTIIGAGVARESPLDSTVVTLLVVIVLTTPFQAAGEEYLFRGFLLQSFGAARLPAFVCALLTGVLFATAHLQFEPALFADRLLIGVVFAYVTIATGGLEAAIALHVVKNLFAFLPAVLLEDLDEAVDPGAITWIPFIVDAVLLAIAVPLILRQARKRQRRWLDSHGLLPAGTRS